MGSGGKFGLWLDEAFEYGSSGRFHRTPQCMRFPPVSAFACRDLMIRCGRCLTYENDPLSARENFKVLKVEFWGFAPSSPVFASAVVQDFSPSMHGSILPDSCFQMQDPPEVEGHRQGSMHALVAGVLSPMIGGMSARARQA